MANFVERNAATEEEVVRTAKAVASASLDENKKDRRTDYYSKWDKFTKEKVEEVEAEDKVEEDKANEALGLDPKAPKSAIEKRDKEKHEMLKEAKKRWDDKKLSEEMMKHSVEDLHDKEVILDSKYLQNKPVLLVRSSKRSKFKLPSRLGHRVVKIFVQECEDCIFDFETETITQHTEISYCKNITINVRAPLATLQLDLCEKVKVNYHQALFDKETKIYHAGVSSLQVETHEGHSHKADYLADGAVATAESPAEEQQFLTQLHHEKEHLYTERVLRTRGDMPTTQTEVDTLKGTAEEDEVTPQTQERAAELKKIGGNEAFSNGEYAQAAVFYTEAIHMAPAGSDLLHKCYANRAFCFQKLGQHEKAEEDARKCIELKPDFVKGHFRLGLALHARGKYFEALPVLSKALELEPKNEAIKQAMGFAEMRARKIQQH